MGEERPAPSVERRPDGEYGTFHAPVDGHNEPTERRGRPLLTGLRLSYTKSLGEYRTSSSSNSSPSYSYSSISSPKMPT